MMNGKRTLENLRRSSSAIVDRGKAIAAETILMVAVGLLFTGMAWAGPPFFTDDPEPVEYRHWEVYLASQWAHDKEAGTSGTLPHLEVNYGPAQDLHLHVLIPATYSAPSEGSAQYGLGDMELGIKYRFIHEDEKGWRPQIGTFPIVVLPTGSSSRGLGEGRVKVLFPLWLQKSWGPWTTYGGGGYWYHPGEDNKNYWFTGWLLQREFSKMLTIGAEVFNASPKAKGESDETGFNVGGYLNLSEEHHVLFSAGRDLKGPNTFFAYLAFQWTFGPKEEKKLSN
ncbi:MAG: hypothetical protein ACHQ0Y_15595 [Thermodesulfovibrionales bacterium]